MEFRLKGNDREGGVVDSKVCMGAGVWGYPEFLCIGISDKSWADD